MTERFVKGKDERVYFRGVDTKEQNHADFVDLTVLLCPTLLYILHVLNRTVGLSFLFVLSDAENFFTVLKSFEVFVF